jgi:hypothetical protein
MSDAQTPVAVSTGGGGPRMLVDGFHYWIPGVVNPDDLEGINAVLMDGSPLKVALNKGGMVLLGEVVTPVPSRTLRSMQVLPATTLHHGKMVSGVVIRLPDHLARLTAGWETLEKGLKYNVGQLLEDYLKDLQKEPGALVEDRVMRELLDGAQFQASTDIRLSPNCFGMSFRTAEIILRRFKEAHPHAEDFQELESMNGLVFLTIGYPEAGPKAVAWMKLVLFADVPDFQILFNPQDWQDKGRDTDGDLGYCAHDGVIRQGKVVDPGPYPHLVRYGEENARGILDRLVAGWQPVTTGSAVERVMGMCIKELVGCLDYTFHCIGRAFAHSLACAIPEVVTRVSAFRRGYVQVFGVYFPIQERVMDARKMEGGLPALYRLAEVLECAVSGKAIDSEAFRPFLNDEQMEFFKGALQSMSFSISRTRNTAFGRLVASGRKRKENILPLMEDMNCQPEALLAVLQADATGVEFHTLDVKKPSKRPRKPGTQKERLVPTVNRAIKPNGEPGDAILHLFRSIEVNGLPVCDQVAFPSTPDGKVQSRNADGTCTVVLRIHPHWLNRTAACERWKVRITIPLIQPVGTDGHCRVSFPGFPGRFFRPKFILEGDEAVKLGLGSVLKEAMRSGFENLINRRGNPKRKAEDVLNRYLRDCVNGFPTSAPLPDLIHRFEYEVGTPGVTGIVRVWKAREQLLKLLSDQGMDVLSTSKNHPGTVVTQATEFGVPAYLMAMNPLAVFLDGKRRVEPREVRRGLLLAHPEEPRLKSLGYPMAQELLTRFTHLTVAVLDCNANMFTRSDGSRFCHDTLVATWEAVAKLSVARLEFYAIDRKQLDLLISRLIDLDLKNIQMETLDEKVDLGDGVVATTWRVIVTGNIRDVGKVKAAAGPIKGVLTVVPLKLSAKRVVNGVTIERPVHLIVPQDTMERKKALDAVLWMLADKAGMTEIDPTLPLPELVTQVRSGLEASGEDVDGLEEIWVQHPNGDKYSLGMALVGDLPFYRPPQTGVSQFAVRLEDNGVSVHTHAMVMAGVHHNSPRRVVREFLTQLRMIGQVSQAKDTLQAQQTSQSGAGTLEGPGYDPNALADAYEMPSMEDLMDYGE